MSQGDGARFFSSKMPGGKKTVRRLFLAAAVIAVAPQASLADEGGVSFWLPGLFGSLAAVPGQPGFSFSTFDYNTNVSASGNVARARQIEIGAISPTVQATVSAKLDADVNFVWLNPTYVFATPVLGGQASVSMGALYGRSNATLDGTLTITSPISATTPVNISSSVTGFGDLYPTAQLKWNDGVNNYMVYGTGDIPVGDYERRRLANLGIGHGAADLGAGYTYLDQKTGHEFSVTGGFTYNLENPSTHYQNGVDLHIDWAASQYLSQKFSVGVVGYLYNEIGCDGGSGDRVGCFQSRVVSIGPQASYLFPVGDMQGYLNLKAYFEFDAQDRPDGWNIWATFAISPAAPTAKAPPSHK